MSCEENEIVCEQEYYEVRKILDSRFNNRIGKQEYLVQWKLWPDDHTWEPSTNLKTQKHKIEEFELKTNLKSKLKQEFSDDKQKRQEATPDTAHETHSCLLDGSAHSGDFEEFEVMEEEPKQQNEEQLQTKQNWEQEITVCDDDWEMQLNQHFKKEQEEKELAQQPQKRRKIKPSQIPNSRCLSELEEEMDKFRKQFSSNYPPPCSLHESNESGSVESNFFESSKVNKEGVSNKENQIKIQEEGDFKTDQISLVEVDYQYKVFWKPRDSGYVPAPKTFTVSRSEQMDSNQLIAKLIQHHSEKLEHVFESHKHINDKQSIFVK